MILSASLFSSSVFLLYLNWLLFYLFSFSLVFSSAFPDPPQFILSSPTGKRVRFEQMSTVLVKGQCFSRLEPSRRQSLPQIVLRYSGISIHPLKSKFIQFAVRLNTLFCRENVCHYNFTQKAFIKLVHPYFI